MCGSKNKCIGHLIELIVESLVFITIEYILLCCRQAFSTNIVSAYLTGISAYIIYKYSNHLHSVMPKTLLFNVLSAAVLVLCLVSILLFVFFFGYLEISPVLKEVIL